LGVSLLLASRIGARELVLTAATLGLGVLNWRWVVRAGETAKTDKTGKAVRAGEADESS
jgi:hypothetical protein